MYNKNKVYNEVSRMIELFENNSEKAELIKNSIKEKIILKEEDDIDFSDIFSDSNDDDGEESKKIESEYDKLNPTDDIPLLRKLALTTFSINKLQAAMFELEKKDFLEVKDLKTKAVVPNDENGARYSKGEKMLYPGQSVKEFSDMLRKGRVMLSMGNTSEEISEEEFNKLYKWFSTKSFHQIGLSTKGIVSPSGNASLNFLARILSNQPKDDVESQILSTFGNAAKSNALKILLDFFQVVSVNYLLPLLNMKATAENIDTIKDGVVEALNNLAGISGTKQELKSTNWKPSRNVSPWVLQIAKNYARNILKKTTEYIPDLTAAKNFLENKLSSEDVIIIPSKKEPSHKNNAYKVEEFKDEKKKGTKYLYYYNNVEDVLEDLENSTKIPNHHLKSSNLDISKFKKLFSSERTAPTAMDLENFKDVPNEMEDILNMDKNSENEIRKILGKVVDFMTTNNQDYDYGITKATHDPDYLTGEDKKEIKSGKDENLIKKRKELAKENAVNFMFNFLLSAIGETKYGSDLGKTGNVLPEIMKQWIESQRKKMLTQLIELEKKNNPKVTTQEIKNRAEKLGLLIKNNKYTQALAKGVKNYFNNNKEDFKKVLNLISSTPKKGYEIEPNIETIFENKIRAKIQKLLKEFYIIKEEELEDFELNLDDINQKIKIFGDRFKKATTYDRNILDEDIKDILNGEMSNWNFQNGEKGQHNYITSVLASLYNSLNTKGKENVFKYIYLSFFPWKEGSKLITSLSTLYSGSFHRLSDLIWDVLNNPEKNGKLLITNALENYEPKGSFFQYLKQRIKNGVSNVLRSSEYTQDTKSTDDDSKNQRQFIQKVSIDAPSREGDEDKRGMDLKTDEDSGLSEELKEKLNNYLSIAEKKGILSKSELELLRNIQKYGDDVMEDGKISYELLSTRIDKSSSNIASTMSNIIKKMRDARKGGLFKK